MPNEAVHSTSVAYGIDGCKAGWFVVSLNLKPFGKICWQLVEGIGDIVGEADASGRVLIDVPIGLPDGGEKRPCDTEARRQLGSPRGRSVFPAPVRRALRAESYDEANQINRNATGGTGVPKQAYSIIPKIREVDDLLRSSEKARCIVREVHPEVCFWAIAGETAMYNSKKTPEGFRERLTVLEKVRRSVRREFDEIMEWRRENRLYNEVARDDILDAIVAAVTASANTLYTLPVEPTLDVCDLPMEMVYAPKHDIP